MRESGYALLVRDVLCSALCCVLYADSLMRSGSAVLFGLGRVLQLHPTRSRDRHNPH